MLLSQERSFYGKQKILTYMLLNYSEEQPISKLAERGVDGEKTCFFCQLMNLHPVLTELGYSLSFILHS